MPSSRDRRCTNFEHGPQKRGNPSPTGRSSRRLCCGPAYPWARPATDSLCSARTSARPPRPGSRLCACFRPAWPAGSAAQSRPTPRPSGRSRSATRSGRSENGSRSFTSAKAFLSPRLNHNLLKLHNLLPNRHLGSPEGGLSLFRSCANVLNVSNKSLHIPSQQSFGLDELIVREARG